MCRSGNERGGLLVGPLHDGLVITQVCVQEGKQLAPGGRFYDLINTWERKRILGACLIEPCVVDTHSPTHVLLDKHEICDPHWVVYFPYESRHQ
jgi:hypothetical protein